MKGSIIPMLTVAVVTILILGGCLLAPPSAPPAPPSAPPTLLPEAEPAPTPTPPALPPEAEPSLFEGGGFSFLYPSNWQTMTEADIDKLWETELRGQIGEFSRQDVIWEGGVFWGQVDPSNYPDSANIFTLIVTVSGIPGQMSEADYDDAFNRVKAAFESGLGERLYSIQKRMVGDLQAIEVVSLGASRNQIVRGIFTFAKPDHLYYFGCGVSNNAQEFFEPIFDETIASLEVRLIE